MSVSTQASIITTTGNEVFLEWHNEWWKKTNRHSDFPWIIKGNIHVWKNSAQYNLVHFNWNWLNAKETWYEWFKSFCAFKIRVFRTFQTNLREKHDFMIKTKQMSGDILHVFAIPLSSPFAGPTLQVTYIMQNRKKLATLTRWILLHFLKLYKEHMCMS